MFGSIGGPEIIFIFILALLLFGPRKLPEIGRTVGRTLAEFKKATNEFTANLDREVEIDKIRETQGALKAVSQEVAGATRDLSDLGRILPGEARVSRAAENPDNPEPPTPPSPADAARTRES